MLDFIVVVFVDSNIDFVGDVFFFLGDIFGLDGFESFVFDMNISDDFSMIFNFVF